MILGDLLDVPGFLGFSVLGLDFSPIQGGHGNIEFLAYLKKEESASNQVLAEIEEVVERAHSQFKKER